MSIIIRRYTDRTKFYCFFRIHLVLFCITVYMGCMFCMLLFDFVYSLFLLLCLCILFYICSVLGIVFHCVILCIVCV